MRPKGYRRFIEMILCSTVLLTSACGTVIVQGAINFPTSASGFVSIVHFTFVADGNGSQTSVTVVTLLSSGSAQELTFCGSHVSDFPMNTVVTAKYTQGAPCSKLISVTLSH